MGSTRSISSLSNLNGCYVAVFGGMVELVAVPLFMSPSCILQK